MMWLVVPWAFAEALVWFVVADVPISAIALRSGFPAAARASLLAAVAAAAGGVLMLKWSAAAPHAAHAVLDRVPGVSPGMIAEAAAAWRDDRFLAMLGGSFSGTPYKLYAHAAGLMETAPAAFFAASLAARLPRFLLVSTVSARLGPVLRRHLAGRQIVLAFAGFWLLFYSVYFLTVGA